MHFDSSIVDLGGLSEEFILLFSVLISDHSLLVTGKRQELTLLFGRKSFELLGSLLDFLSEHGKDSISLILHNTSSDTCKSSLERRSLELFLLSVLDSIENNFVSILGDLGDVMLKVLSFVSLDGVEHVDSSVVEMLLEVELLVGQEVDKGSLLDKVVLAVESGQLKLVLGVSGVLQLVLLSEIGPLVGELLLLVVGVDTVPESPLGS